MGMLHRFSTFQTVGPPRSLNIQKICYSMNFIAIERKQPLQNHEQSLQRWFIILGHRTFAAKFGWLCGNTASRMIEIYIVSWQEVLSERTECTRNHFRGDFQDFQNVVFSICTQPSSEHLILHTTSCFLLKLSKAVHIINNALPAV